MALVGIHRANEQTRVVLAELSRMREDVLTSRERALLSVATTLGKNLQTALRAIDDIDRAPTRDYADPRSARLIRAVAHHDITGPLARLAGTIQSIDLPRFTNTDSTPT